MEKVREYCGDLLAKKKVEGILGLKETPAGVAPFFFRDKEDLEGLVLTPRYSMASLCASIRKGYPKAKFGVVLRGCDYRALLELKKRNKISMEHLVPIGVPCSKEEAKACGCTRPYPPDVVAGEKAEGAELREREKALLQMPREERLKYWASVLYKCIKCYGCRNACPLCICEECRLEDREWVETGKTPPQFPLFHLIRAYHTIGRCIGCGECERACPVDIPLTTLYALLRKDVEELLGFEAGLDGETEISLFTDQ